MFTIYKILWTEILKFRKFVAELNGSENVLGLLESYMKFLVKNTLKEKFGVFGKR